MEHDFCHNRRADKCARRYHQGNGDDAPGQSLECGDIFTEGQTAIRQDRRAGCQEVDILGDGRNPFGTGDARNRNDDGDNGDPEYIGQLVQYRDVGDEDADKADGNDDQDTEPVVERIDFETDEVSYEGEDAGDEEDEQVIAQGRSFFLLPVLPFLLF